MTEPKPPVKDVVVEETAKPAEEAPPVTKKEELKVEQENYLKDIIAS